MAKLTTPRRRRNKRADVATWQASSQQGKTRWPASPASRLLPPINTRSRTEIGAIRLVCSSGIQYAKYLEHDLALRVTFCQVSLASIFVVDGEAAGNDDRTGRNNGR